MNYIALVNQFWVKNLEYSFTPNELAVYFHLLDRCNTLGWKNPFNLSVEELLMKLRLKTKDPLDTARNRLKQAGLLDFKNGQGRGHATTYWLAPPMEEAEENPGKKGKKNTPFISPFSPTFSPPFLPPEEPLVHKTKLNKTKKKEANASRSSAPSASLSSSSPAPTSPTDAYQPAFQTWENWARENAAQVLLLKAPLTPTELHRLVADFGQPLVWEVFEAMHNHAPLLKKYTSANLTARDWCRRRAADPKAGNAPAKTRPAATQAAKLQRQTQHDYN